MTSPDIISEHLYSYLSLRIVQQSEHLDIAILAEFDMYPFIRVVINESLRSMYFADVCILLD
ncbi:MAG TPA: hypothetical protein VJ044_16875 [Candidatus Hodarchaeales archaeon]|nr:hypothetical protein [Candidatus Hodarchaeales archaeon]